MTDPARPRSRSRRILLVALSFTAVLALTSGVAVVVLYRYYDSRITRVDVLKTSDPKIIDSKLQLHAANFLVIGSDSRVGAQGKFGIVDGARSDTTMLVHPSPDRKHATSISLPRDAWVSIPACRVADGSVQAAHVGQFNSAFDDGGAACTIATVQALTGIKISHYVEINLEGFKNIVSSTRARSPSIPPRSPAGTTPRPVSRVRVGCYWTPRPDGCSTQRSSETRLRRCSLARPPRLR